MRYTIAEYPQDWICDDCMKCGDPKCCKGKRRMYVNLRTDKAYCEDCAKKRRLKCVKHTA